MQDLRAIKLELHQYCLKQINESLSALRQSMEDAQEAANSEEKSSAGDKYETGRAMAQLEHEKAASQLGETEKMARVVELIDPEKSTTEIKVGSLVVTDKGKFYISIPIGKIQLESGLYFAVSSVSPIGDLLRGKKAGESIKLNGNTFKILEVA
ncbi:MAG: 3-oxoacyl-ACP synthase [Bacteroidia bacterium]|nr:3-oxoacyl-ACP synthase [Bacteroidia bacterium]